MIDRTNDLLESVATNNPKIWNSWVESNPPQPVTVKCSLNPSPSSQKRGENYLFNNVIFEMCNFDNIFFSDSHFISAIFKGCTFNNHTKFSYCNFTSSEFINCNINKTRFTNCHLNSAKYSSGTRLVDVDFYGSSLIKAFFLDTDIKKCKVYGANIWDITMSNVKQDNIYIADSRDLSTIDDSTKIDDIELAHLLNLLTNNSKFSSLFAEVQSRFVLILGSFGERHDNLDRIRKKITSYDEYIPILFDWDKKHDLDFIETIIMLAGFSKFIIVDLSGPRSVPAELQAILSTLLIPVIPIISSDEREFGVYSSFTNKYNWINGIIKYDTIEQVLSKFDDAIIAPAMSMVEEIKRVRSKDVKFQHINDI